MKHSLMAGLMVLLIIPMVAMAERDDHDHREHKAHAHGHGQLNIALEGNELHIELDSPAANIVGFEYAARTDQERRQVNEAMHELQQPESLFVTEADAGCHSIHVNVDADLIAGKSHAGHQEQDHDKDHHKEGHGKEAHHDEDHHKETHSDVSVQYVFRCAHTGNLKSIYVKLFERFPNTETLKVQFIGESGQKAVTLKKASPVFRLN